MVSLLRCWAAALGDKSSVCVGTARSVSDLNYCLNLGCVQVKSSTYL